ncbi:MAG: ChrR family anti-sigma-E factor [Paracoccaceae bacterium]|nr:MAG: ChrR family anti-sigma-E factor [Paracoccaceae bacterium]
MTIRHHLSDALLMAYAAGELPEAISLVVATHLSMCDECRVRNAAFDAVGGAVIEEGAAAEMSDDSLAACLARIDGLPRDTTRPAPRPKGDVPAPLSEYIGPSLAAVNWRPIGMGVRQSILTTGRGASARLLYIPAGQAMPDHGHRGIEVTLVLRGAFMDGAQRFGPGDVEIADESTDHTPVAEEWSDCICLAAADGRLRFRGLLPRLAQPFFRI